MPWEESLNLQTRVSLEKVPTQVCTNTGSVCGGAAFYSTSNLLVLPLKAEILYSLGIIVSLFGVVLVSLFKHHTS